MDLIAVIMAAPDYKVRFADATNLLNYGFGRCQIYEDKNEDALPALPVTGGAEDLVPLRYEGSFRYLDTTGADLNTITKEFKLPEAAAAPVAKDEAAGTVVYKLDGKEIGSINLLFDDSVEKAHFKDYLQQLFELLLV